MSGKFKILNVFSQTLCRKSTLATSTTLVNRTLYSFSSLSRQRISVLEKVNEGNYGINCGYGVFCNKFSTKTSKEVPGPPPPEETPPEKKPSLLQRFKAMYRDYWYVLVPVHVISSAGWFGTFFYLAKSGVDLASVAEQLNLSESIIIKLREKANTTTGYLAISYLLYKIATPLRYTVTLGGTTVSINYLKKWGYIKPIPKRAELKKMLSDKRESFKEKRESVRMNIRNRLKKRKS